MKRQLWGKKQLILTILLITFLLLSVIPAYAQLTKKDIDELKKQAVEEGWTFTVSENEATQYSLEQLCGMKEPAHWRKNARFISFTNKVDLPERFDWRDYDGCTPVKNQGGCGSCWAFGTVGPLECAIKIQDGVTVDLSEQWLVSCNRNGWGCDGGWFAHDYHQWKGDPCNEFGAVLESDYPYSGWDAPCNCPVPHPYTIANWAYIGNGSDIPTVEEMKQAIMQYGPISVCVYVNNAFQAYSGGVFNGCASGTINHAVVLVGWDDTQGANGVWYMRNSWGPGWGEDGGYMRIPYGCSEIGYAACFVDYIGGVTFDADTTVGWVPFDVNFTGISGLDVQSWAWDFGDGDSAFVQSPTHTYTAPGMYDVSVQVDVGGGDYRTRSKPNFVMALADTIFASDKSAQRNSSIEVVVSAINHVPLSYIEIPVEYDGDLSLILDSFSTVGCRTDYFEDQGYVNSDPLHKRKTISLFCSHSGTSPNLPSGEGPIVSLFFTVAPDALAGQSTNINFDGYLSYKPTFSWPLLIYEPAVNSCTISVCQTHGDIDGTVGITVSDVTYLVEYLFNGGPPSVPEELADVTCSDGINIGDLTYLVNYLFSGGTPPPECCE